MYKTDFPAQASQAPLRPSAEERRRRIDLVIRALNQEPDSRVFDAPKDLENTDRAFVRAIATTDTVAQVAVDALNAAGIVVQPTIGGLMDALDLPVDYMHSVFCFCHEPTTSGRKVALRLGNVASQL